MKLFLMPKEPTWWFWLITAALLAAGLAGQPVAFVAAVALSAIQTVWFLARHRSWSYAAQIRFAFTLFLIAGLPRPCNWIYWLPLIGIFARVLFGYCLLARMLSLAPWNRQEHLTLDFVRRTFLSPPVIGNARQGLPASGCGGGLCSLEAAAAGLNRRH